MKSLIDKIIEAHENGVFYGNEYRKMNIYDYYLLKDELTTTELISYAKKIYNPTDYQKASDILTSFSEDTITKSELMSIVSRDSNLNKNQINDIISYLEYSNLPLSKELFYATLERYNDHDITFEEDMKVVNK